MENQTKTRLAGVWTRMGGTARKPVGQGRLHAARRTMGSLEPDALCGFKIPQAALSRRPYAFFDETVPKACATCVTESWGL